MSWRNLILYNKEEREREILPITRCIESQMLPEVFLAALMENKEIFSKWHIDGSEGVSEEEPLFIFN